MARRKTRRASSSRSITVRSAPAQIIRVPSGGGPIRRRRSGGRRRHGGGGHGLSSNALFGSAMAGALLGFVDTAIGTKLPTIPMLGRAGTIAVACLLLGKGKGHGMIRDMGLVAAGVAGYEIGTKGAVSGSVMGAIPSQVRGIAAQV